MTDYKKIAIILLRASGFTMIFSGVLELGMVLAAILLISLGVVPQEAIAHEAWFIGGIFWILGGMILYVRSRTLGAMIVESLYLAEPK